MATNKKYQIMYKERLFKLINKGEIILFAGAGLSIPAGFPNGNGLKNILWESLGDEEKEILNRENSLAKLTEHIHDLHGSKHHIIKVLKETFLKEIESETHRIISQTPQIKTIITTNYDNLFENHLKDNGEVILQDNDITYIDKNKTQIYKIHGDLSNVDSIIINESDYQNFFNENKELSLYWNHIKNIMATNYILFVGYSLEDPNIKLIFDKITNTLGKHRKQCFFVSPNLEELYKNKLIKNNINYINDTGENLFKELEVYLKENAIPELEKGNAKPEDIIKMFKTRGLDATFVTDTTKTYFMGLKKGDTPVPLKINLSTTEHYNSYLQDTLFGKSFGDYTLTKDKIKKFRLEVEGFTLKNIHDLSSLTIKPIPNFSGYIDIISDDGVEINNLFVEVFNVIPSENIRKIKVMGESVVLNIVVELTEKEINVNLNIDLKEVIKDVKSTLDFYLLLDKIYEGIGLTILSEGKQLITIPKCVLKQSKFTFNMIEYFSSLQKIERFFKVKFNNIKYNDITDENVENVKMLIAKIDKKNYSKTFGRLSGVLTKDFDRGFLSFNNEEMSCCYQMKEQHIVNIHGHEFSLGYIMFQIIEPIIENIEDISDGKTDKFVLKSKLNMQKLFFYDEYLGDNIL